MKLRGKLLLLLLATALVPLVGVRIVDFIATQRLGHRIAQGAREQVSRETGQGLTRIVEAIAILIDREELICRLILDEQAAAIEERLALAEPPSAGVSIHDADAFLPGGDVFPAMVTSVRHGTVTDDGVVRPVRVSFDHQISFHLPGADPAKADDLARRMADLPVVYREALAEFPERLLWQYTGFVDGLHIAFPGKAGYPEGYDSRQRPWFRRAVDPLAESARGIRDDADIDGVVWNPPMIDAASGQVILTLSRAVRHPDGRIAGVTAIDIPMDTVLDSTRLGVDWSSQARLMIVSMEDAAQVGRGGGSTTSDANRPATGRVPVVFADSGRTLASRDWEKDFEFTLLALDDADAQQRVLNGITSRQPGSLETRLDGQPVVLAHGPIDAPTPMAVVVTAPLGVIAKQADALAAQVDHQINTLLVFSEVMVLVVMGAVLLVAWRASRSVTRPVTELAGAAQRVAEGDLDVAVEVGPRKDELADLGRSFNTMVPQLRDHLKLRSSLGVAMQVQQCLLPRHAPSMAGLDIAGLTDYCDETGGDYFDFLEMESLGPNRIGLALGDVTGHGIAAALLMATARAFLRGRAALPGSLVELFTQVNKQLCDSRFTGRFMTLFYLVVESDPAGADLRVQWISAGHDPAIVYDPATDTFEDWEGSDLPLGIESDWEFTEYAKELPGAKGSRRVVVLGTDGIWEARCEADTMYGKERLQDVIRQHAADSADTIAKAILADVHAFRGKREQLDDITLIVLKMV